MASELPEDLERKKLRSCGNSEGGEPPANQFPLSCTPGM